MDPQLPYMIPDLMLPTPPTRTAFTRRRSPIHYISTRSMSTRSISTHLIPLPTSHSRFLIIMYLRT